MTLKVIAPDRRVFREERVTTGANGFADYTLDIPEWAPTGTYSVNLLLNPETTMGSVAIRVEDFMPDRMKVDLALTVGGEEKEIVAPGDSLELEIEAMTLFGPPAAGREAQAANLGKIMQDAGLALHSELRKLGYILVRIVPLLLLFLVPVIGPLLWALFSAWMLAIAYVDYPMGNHGNTFPDQRRVLREQRWMALGFGIAVMAGMAVPVLNFIIMPCAVAGATVMYVEAIAPGLPAATQDRITDQGS